MSVTDTTAPVLTRVGDAAVTIAERVEYVDEGAMATDACDNGVTAVTSGTVNTSVPGVYTITHTATDSSGNTSTATRAVTVAETDFGKITKVTKLSGGVLKLQYTNGEVRRITPFGASNNFRYALSTSKKRLVVTNGKEVRVFLNGRRVARKVISKKTLSQANYRMSIRKVYDGYDSIFIATARQKTARVYALRLTTANTVTKQKSKAFSIVSLSNPTLSIHKSKKQVTVTYGKSGERVKRTWKLQKNGDFSLVK